MTEALSPNITRALQRLALARARCMEYDRLAPTQNKADARYIRDRLDEAIAALEAEIRERAGGR